MESFIDRLRIPIYDHSIFIMFDVVDSDVIKHFDSLGYDRDQYDEVINRDPGDVGLTHIMPNGNVVMLIHKNKDGSYDNVINHECFHATHFILDRIGMKFEIGVSDEAYAYLNAWIIDQVKKNFIL